MPTDQAQAPRKLGGRDLIRALAPLLGIADVERVTRITLTVPADEAVMVTIELKADTRLLEMDWSVLEGSQPKRGKNGSAK
jgi:hypothetical protein